MDTKGNNIFIVLGMARSGTSAITKGLNALGVDLGDKLTHANERWNPKGFWEDNDIVYQINGKVFSTLDFQPYGIKMPDQAQQTSSALIPIRDSAIDLLKKRFSTTHHYGFKDPSTIKLLPFWQDIFARMHLKENYLIALRNPLSVASSYKSLTGSELEIGLLLWLMHLTQAIDGTEGKNRIIVSYESLLQNPKNELARIKNSMGLPTSLDAAEQERYANEFLDKALHRHDYSYDDLHSHPSMGVIPICLEVYDLLMRLAKDDITFNSHEFLIAWQDIKTKLAMLYPVYCYIDVLLKRVNHQERKLKDIHKSFLWKMLYPFRKIDDFLRQKRKKPRASRRLNKAYG